MKLCQVFTKIHIYPILYKSCSIKQIIYSKYATNLKMTISHRSLRISGLLLSQFFILHFAFSIDVIDNIITYSPYSPYYVTLNFSQWQCSMLVTLFPSVSRDNDTPLPVAKDHFTLQSLEMEDDFELQRQSLEYVCK